MVLGMVRLVMRLVKRLLKKMLKFYLLTPVAICFSLFVLLQLVLAVVKHGPRVVFRTKHRYQPPVCMQDPALGSHGYVYLEEVRLHYVSSGSEDKPLMLLIHGFPEFWYSWRHQLKEFKHDYRVVAVDQRGYGDSDKPSSVSSYDMDHLIEDVRQLIGALGYKKCVLVGHDMGGKVAWTFAQTYPDLVDRFIVMNCPSTIAHFRHAQTGLSQLRKVWYFFFMQVPWLPELFQQSGDYAFLDTCFLKKPFGVTSGEMTQEDVEAYKYTFGRGGFTAPINYYRQMLRSESFPSLRKSDYSFVSRPTLIVWGDQDQALETPLATLSSKLSVQGGATVSVVEGASHWVQMDRPDLVNKYMRDFLAWR